LFKRENNSNIVQNSKSSWQSRNRGLNVGEYLTHPLEEPANDLFVPEETPVRRVYKSWRLYSKQSLMQEKNRLVPKVLVEESDSEMSQVEESKNERIVPLMSFRVHPSVPLRPFINPIMVDVDNMSYEELLALGEFIGKVSKGLSKEQIAVPYFLIFIENTNSSI